MRTLAIVGWMGVVWVLAAGCGGESSSSDDPPSAPVGDAGNAGAPSSDDGGAGGADSGERPGGAGGEAAGGDASGAGAGGDPSGDSGEGGAPAGGAAAGGAAAGGTPAGGAAGEPIPVPEGCETEYGFQGSGLCNLELTCNATQFTVSCNEGSGDDWRCYCQGDVGGSYDVQAPTSGLACAMGSLLCSGNVPEPSEPEVCEAEEMPGEVTCVISDTCRREVDVDGETVAIVTKTQGVTCAQTDVELVTCACPNEPAIDVSFQGVDLEDGCGFALEFCKTRERPAADARTCAPQAMSSSSGYCDLTRACEAPIELDGTVVSLSTSDYVSCSAAEDGSSSCYCSDQVETFVFQLPGSPTSTATCAGAAELCDRRAELERSQTIDCEVAAQSASGSTCDAFLECRQGAMIGETEVLLSAPIQVFCGPAGSGWGCDCVSGPNRAELTLEAEDAWGACSAAIEACPGVVELTSQSL